MANERSLSNLRPWKPGQSGNPGGTNQYTYRDEAKETFAKLCKENADDFLEEVFRLAKEGESWAAKMVWEEIMPAVKTIDLNVNEPPKSPDFIPSERDQEELLGALQASEYVY
jgi:hypothetical protein